MATFIYLFNIQNQVRRARADPHDLQPWPLLDAAQRPKGLATIGSWLLRPWGRGWSAAPAAEGARGCAQDGLGRVREATRRLSVSLGLGAGISGPLG